MSQGGLGEDIPTHEDSQHGECEPCSGEVDARLWLADSSHHKADKRYNEQDGSSGHVGFPCDRLPADRLLLTLYIGCGRVEVRYGGLVLLSVGSAGSTIRVGVVRTSLVTF